MIELFSLISLTHHENICELLVNSSGKRIDVNFSPGGTYGDGWEFSVSMFKEKWFFLILFFVQKVCMFVIPWGTVDCVEVATAKNSCCYPRPGTLLSRLGLG